MRSVPQQQFRKPPNQPIVNTRRYNTGVQKKIFWVLVLVLGLIADVTLPLIWGFVATIPIIFVSWWIVYRSNWFGDWL